MNEHDMNRNTQNRIDFLEERNEELQGLLKLAAKYIDLLESCQDPYYQATSSIEAANLKKALSQRPLPFDPQRPTIFEELTALNSQYDDLNSECLKFRYALCRIASLETPKPNATVKKMAKIAKTAIGHGDN